MLQRDVKLESRMGVGRAAADDRELGQPELVCCRSKIPDARRSWINGDDLAGSSDSPCEPERVDADVASNIYNEVPRVHGGECPSQFRFRQVIRLVGVQREAGTRR